MVVILASLDNDRTYCADRKAALSHNEPQKHCHPNPQEKQTAPRPLMFSQLSALGDGPKRPALGRYRTLFRLAEPINQYRKHVPLPQIKAVPQAGFGSVAADGVGVVDRLKFLPHERHE